MSTLVCTLQGRFGNQCLQWLFAFAYAQKHGMAFECGEWIGERVFSLPPYGRPAKGYPLLRFNELNIQPIDCEFRGYAQHQAAMIYARREARAWLRIRPEVEAMCWMPDPALTTACHLRRGDYAGYSYVLPSRASYVSALAEYGLNHTAIFLSDDWPTPNDQLPDDLKFVQDFYRMVKAKVLLRANSTFSWLAALLGDGLVLSPVIEGLEGGREHFCRFVPGNWPRFANLDFVTDLFVNEI